MNRLLIIAGLILLATALVFLNQGVRKSAVPDHDDDEKPAQTQSQAQKPPLTPADPEAVLPPEETVGNPATAKHHIAAGWVYDDENQQKPETLAVPIQAIRDYVNQSEGAVSAEIVDLDVPAEDRSPAAQGVMDLGIHVDGQYLYGGNLSGAPISPGQIMQALDGAIRNGAIRKR